MIITGFISIMLGTSWFGLAHLRWPRWITTMRVRFYRAPYWPDEFFRSERENIAQSLVLVERAIELSPHGFSINDPFVILTFRIFNGAVCPVSFEKNVDGDVYLESYLVLSQPSVTEGAGPWWRRGDVARVRIRLKLNPAHWKLLSETAKNGTLTETINTDGAYLVVKGDFMGSMSQRFLLRVALGFVVEKKL